MLDYKNILTLHFAGNLSGNEIAQRLGSASKTGVNDFLRAFKKCESLAYPLPEGITNYGIYLIVYGHNPGSNCRGDGYEKPDFLFIHQQMTVRKNMTLTYLWNKYSRQCISEEKKPYQYRQFCELYGKWCEHNYESLHIQPVIGQKMEVDFAGKTFNLIDRFTGDITVIIVFVAVLPYSQYIYAEGMVSVKEPQWIEVNNHALEYFGGVPAIVVCDNCKQAVIRNRDWINPDLNKDYAAWAEHNHTVVIPAKVGKPKHKSSVENAVGILEKGFFHDMDNNRYFSLDQFNQDLWNRLSQLNRTPFSHKEHNRSFYWEEEKQELMPLPSMQYQYMERKTAKVSSDFHIRFDNAYYSVDKAYIHQNIMVAATTDTVKIYSMSGVFICEWPRATRKGEWKTDKNHLPRSFGEFSQWNSSFFIGKAMKVGPCTVKVIQEVLKSRPVEVQTYRLCLGILNFTGKYSRLALEDCCRLAIDSNHMSYSFIKNSIAAVAEDLGTAGYETKLNEEKNKGGYLMNPHVGDLTELLARSSSLADTRRKDTDHE